MRRTHIGRTRKGTYYFLVLIVFILIVLTVSGVFLYRIQKDSERKLADVQKEYDKYSKIVYVATEPLSSGCILMEDDVIQKEILSDDDEPNIDEQDIGKTIAVDIQEGQQIMKNMLYEEREDGLKECELYVTEMSSNLVENDYVDIRILYPNGENYIVLSKKLLSDMSVENNFCRLLLNEEEQMQLSSATVDAYNYGAVLYTTRYINDSQDKAQGTYFPSMDVMIAMANDRNIDADNARELNLAARRALEERLEKYFEAHKRTDEEEAQE